MVGDPQQRVSIGVDPSTKHLALVAITSGEAPLAVLVAQLSSLGSESWHVAKLQRARDVMSHFLGMIPRNAGGEALVEAPIQGRGGPLPTFVQCFVSGVIQLALADAADAGAANGWQVATINASTWRSDLGVPGRRTDDIKANTAKVIREQYPDVWRGLQAWNGRDDPDQNLIDAAGIALVGRLRGLRPVGQAVGS